MAFPTVASLLIGGASVRVARISHVLVGTFLFQSVLTTSLPLVNELVAKRGAGAEIGNIPEIARLALAAASRWGLVFAAVDLMRDASTGRLVLLECNSAPFFTVFEARTGIDISGRLASHLAGREWR